MGGALSGTPHASEVGQGGEGLEILGDVLITAALALDALEITATPELSSAWRSSKYHA